MTKQPYTKPQAEWTKHSDYRYQEDNPPVTEGQSNSAGIFAVVVVMLLIGIAAIFIVQHKMEADAELRTVHNRPANSAAEAREIAEIKCRRLPAGTERDNWCRILRM